MSPRKPLKPKEITELLSKLKDTTPDYPAEMMAAQKAVFLKQAVNIKIEGKGQGGEGGQQGGGSGSVGSGGTGAALGGGTATPSILLQALIGISIVAGMFLAAYALRDQIIDTIQGSEVAVQEKINVAIPSPLTPATVTVVPSSLVLATPPTETILTQTPDAQENIEINGASVVQGTQQAGIAADGTKTNSGLHLGQTPGTPAAPGQGNPGNPNKPDKEKPQKPDKPEKPKKPTKEPK